MTDLIVVASSGTGTIAHVKKVVTGEEWENVYVIGTREAYSELGLEKGVLIEIDPHDMIGVIRDKIHDYLRGKLKGLEVGLNFVSGSGKEHMAAISALLKLGMGFRLIALTPEGVQEI